MRIFFIAVLSYCSVFASENTEAVFTEIYQTAGWGTNEEGKGFSGSGSTTANTAAYSSFLKEFIKVNQIKSVVDAGCGDWTFSKDIEWGDVTYLGVDVVKSVIDEDIAKYTSDNIHFAHIDMLQDDMPVADLLVCKDVLMHLSNEDILSFLKKTRQYKHCLFINNLDSNDSSCENHEIARGGFRPLDLTKAPFDLGGIRIFTYFTDHAVKQVVYCSNQGCK